MDQAMSSSGGRVLASRVQRAVQHTDVPCTSALQVLLRQGQLMLLLATRAQACTKLPAAFQMEDSGIETTLVFVGSDRDPPAALRQRWTC